MQRMIAEDHNYVCNVCCDGVVPYKHWNIPRNEQKFVYEFSCITNLNIFKGYHELSLMGIVL